MWGNKSGAQAEGLWLSGPLRQAIAPLFIILGTLAFLPIVVLGIMEHDGSLPRVLSAVTADPIGFYTAWFQPPSQTGITILLVWSAFQLALMRIVPGKVYRGPVTAAGNVPVYTANGFQCYVITVVTYLVSVYYFKLFDPVVVYDHYKEMIAALNVFSLVLCLFLYLKGLYFPSSTDCGTNGNVVMDYYWGTELYPRIFGWDVKMFTNCRFGMMAWAILPLVFAAKSQAVHGSVSWALVVNIALQLVYVSKFFLWETGYLASMDIMHDRAGYYLCWGCLCWVPSVYVSHSLYLVHHNLDMSFPVAAAIFAAGYLAICINYEADRQRAYARATGGNCIIWGRKPDMITASYTTETGEVKKSLLLASGWWSVARHFHYIPELAAAFFWCAPTFVPSNPSFLGFFYFIFLTPLLVDRAFRDDSRCAAKYGKFWEEYQRRVPYKILPYIL